MEPQTSQDLMLAEVGSAFFRPQRQWVEGQGLFLIVGHFLSSVGVGTWVLSTDSPV